jgi:chromosomal replication initiator protein
LLDDLHFLSKEERIQEEFFHLLNCLGKGNQRLVCTCDRLPKFLEDFWGKSDLPHGEIVEIHPTDFELRVSILKQKTKERGWAAVPLKVIHYLAKHLTEHVRQLEGALNRLLAHASLGSPLTIHVARHVVEGRSLAPASTNAITLEEIQEVVARYFHLSLSDLCSRKRKRRYVLPRQIAMYLAHQLTPLSLSEICQGFGQSNRAVIVRSCHRIESLLKEDLVLSQSTAVITHELTQYRCMPQTPASEEK